MKRFFVALLTVTFSNSTYAWNARGHMIMAAIAYKQPSDKQKIKVTVLPKMHPEYFRTWRIHYNDLHDEVGLGIYLFMLASVWLMRPGVIFTLNGTNSRI